MFSPAMRRARRAQVRTLLATRDKCRAGISPMKRDSSSSRSGRAAANSSRYRLAISASPRICSADAVFSPDRDGLIDCNSAGADPDMCASAGESSPASRARRPLKTLARTRVTPSTSTCKWVASSRRTRLAASVDAAMFRLKTASADASQAEVAGMSDLVAAMHGDDAAGQVVITGLAKARGTQHVEQRLLVRMHADGFREIAVAVGILGDEFAQDRQNVE